MKELLTKALWKNQPRRELFLAAAGCFAGTFLLLAAVQFQTDARSTLEAREAPTNYFSINKRISGSGIENVGKSYDFNASEISEIQNRPEILELGTFARSRFAVTLHLWPAGKLFGLGKAAKADVFFESVPDQFIDTKAESWQWKPGDPFIPLIIPKFYLDLWNLGFAPTREEYPTLGMEAALRMPLDVFLGNPPDEMLAGKFVGFSRRINGILVPESFLDWANEKYSLEEDLNATSSSSRLIVRTEAAPGKELISFLEGLDYELNREMPEGDGLNDAITWAFLALAGIGIAISLLSVATFAVSFRLVVTRAAERITNLLYLGFEHQALSQIYLSRFLRLFAISFVASFLTLWVTKNAVNQKLSELSIEVPVGLAEPTFVVAGLYVLLFAATNLFVIRNAIRKLG
tara:strand:+ start:4179 stop:5393 length:1215 start_codon:yes stop_codon:yes gene_type:complete